MQSAKWRIIFSRGRGKYKAHLGKVRFIYIDRYITLLLILLAIHIVSEWRSNEQ